MLSKYATDEMMMCDVFGVCCCMVDDFHTYSRLDSRDCQIPQCDIVTNTNATALLNLDFQL